MIRPRRRKTLRSALVRRCLTVLEDPSAPGVTDDERYGAISLCTPILLSRLPMKEILNGPVATVPVETTSCAYSHLR